MAQKEKSNGELTNKEVEQEVNRNNKLNKNERSYVGSQDNGDNIVRAYGTEVQQDDGFIPDDREKQDNRENTK